jgi:putative drug exporter of the RND superfamily
MDHGSVYRRCGCRDMNTGRLLGARCPGLSSPEHGSWYFSADLPSAAGELRSRPICSGRRSRTAIPAGQEIRDDDLPLVSRAGGTGYVAGNTAADIDVSARLGSALPLFIAIIVLLAFVLLMTAFRSLLVPLTAVIGFLLSVAASLGVMVWVFQYGHLGGLVGAAAAAPIVSFVPVLLVGVLFGLAMDYEVFLISRMRERFGRDRDPGAAVAAGLQRSGRVVCAAALIMTSVFAGFIPAGDPIVKSIAFALTTGVVIDAFIIRLTIIPAVMTLLGRAAWWLPGWLDRILPHADVEGASLPSPASHASREQVTI